MLARPRDEMTQAVHMKRFILLLTALCIAGCQATRHSEEGDFSQVLVSVYKTPGDAQEVQTGHFGIAPLELVRASELKYGGATDAKVPGVLQVETASGRMGWVAISDLPMNHGGAR